MLESVTRWELINIANYGTGTLAHEGQMGTQGVAKD